MDISYLGWREWGANQEFTRVKLPILLWEADKVFSVDTLTEEVSPITAEDLFLATKKILRLRGAGLPVPVFCLLVASAIRSTGEVPQHYQREITFQMIMGVMLNEVFCFDLWNTSVKGPIITALMRREGLDTDIPQWGVLLTVAQDIVREVHLAETEGFAERSGIQAAKDELRLLRAWYGLGDYPVLLDEKIRTAGRVLAACENRVVPDWSWAEFKSKVDLILGGSDCTLDFMGANGADR